MQRTEIDGVTCFWVDSGRPTLAAWLLFRIGSADEPVAESGWLHLLEHSALHGRGGGALHVNGFVAPLVTGFDTHGPTDLVTRHLREVTAWLAAPDLSDLDRERNVLRAEAELRGGPAVRLLGWRYGARGPGVVAMGENGLGRATPELLVERSRQVFTRGNAVLVLDGPPPPDLALTLPPGDLLPVSPAVPCDGPVPGWYADPAGLVVSGVVPRSPASTVLPDVLERALRSAYRDTAGAAYAPWATYEAVDEGHAVVIAGTDVSREHYPRLGLTALDIVRNLSLDGPAEGHLPEIVASRTQTLNDPYNSVAVAARAAHDHLRGRASLTKEDLLDELHCVTSEDIREVAWDFRKTLLVGIPDASFPVPKTDRILQPRNEGWVTGRRFRHRAWPAESAYLVVDRHDAHFVAEPEHQCYHADDVEGILAFADGGRHLITRDGWGLTVEPDEWRGGEELVSALDAMVPRERHLPMPARDGLTPPARVSFLKRWWVARKRPLSPIALAVLGVVLMLLAVASLIFGSPLIGAIWLWWSGVEVSKGWRRWRERTYRGRGESGASET